MSSMLKAQESEALPVSIIFPEMFLKMDPNISSAMSWINGKGKRKFNLLLQVANGHVEEYSDQQ